MPAAVAAISSNDEPRSARTFTVTVSPTFSASMPTFVGIPADQRRKTVLSPVAKVSTWLLPSNERSAGRLPFSTESVTEEDDLAVSSPV